MWDVPYVLVVLFGAASLIAEATRQFATPINITSHDRYPILRGVELSSLSTPNEYIRGYILYILSYLVVYLAFLIWTELFELLEATSPSIKTAGAAGSPNVQAGDGGLLDTRGYGKPIFISAAIIFALSSGVFSRVEGWVRSFAHRLAGIPRGVYRVITQLSRIDYSVFDNTHQLLLTREFEGIVSKLKLGDFERPMVTEIGNAVREIDLLSPSVIGQYSRQVWPSENVNAFDHLVEKQKASVAELRGMKRALLENPNMMEEFHQQALITRNNIQALFAVLFIRNKKIVLPSNNNPTAMIINALREKKSNVIFQTLVGATLITFLMTLATCTLLDISYQYHLEELKFQNGKIETKPVFMTVFENELGTAVNVALPFVLKFAAFFVAAAALAALGRKNFLEMGQWPVLNLRRIPYQRFMGTAIFPAIMATLTYGGLEFLENTGRVYLNTDKLITANTLGDLVRQTAEFAMMTLGFGVLISFFVFIVSDMHNRISAFQTLLIGLTFSALFLMWSFLTVLATYGEAMPLLQTIKETMNFFAFAFFFFISFSVLIELAEE